ncbi:MAG TPA: hypothetical protein VFA18_13925, partial [Gemmataceae bacterium]|nr:hypothetical protein [Gemmataceae bacterium]
MVPSGSSSGTAERRKKCYGSPEADSFCIRLGGELMGTQRQQSPFLDAQTRDQLVAGLLAHARAQGFVRPRDVR